MIHYPLYRAILVQVMLRVRVGIPHYFREESAGSNAGYGSGRIGNHLARSLAFAALSEVCSHLIVLVRTGFSIFHNVKWNYHHRRLWRVCKIFV